ncbi:uncharacterized protein LOC144439399 [Glandiceps talaboti]
MSSVILTSFILLVVAATPRAERMTSSTILDMLSSKYNITLSDGVLYQERSGLGPKDILLIGYYGKYLKIGHRGKVELTTNKSDAFLVRESVRNPNIVAIKNKHGCYLCIDKKGRVKGNCKNKPLKKRRYCHLIETYTDAERVSYVTYSSLYAKRKLNNTVYMAITKNGKIKTFRPDNAKKHLKSIEFQYKHV